MLRNYFSVAWRNLRKNKLYSLINIGGLAAGICICMLILLYVVHEMSYDKFHRNADRIFFPVIKLKAEDRELMIDRLSYSSADLLKEADPGVKSFLRIQQIDGDVVIQNVANPELKFKEQKVLLADSNFFNFFSFTLRTGNPVDVLKRPFTMVISESAATRYFGKINPVGKTLKYENKHVFEITGVAANPPSNSSIVYDFIVSINSLPGMSDEQNMSTGKFEGGSFKTYFLLDNNDNSSRTAQIMQRLAGMTEINGKFTTTLKPLHELRSLYGLPSGKTYIKIYSWAAALILLLALINYMSLATARAALRSAEVAVRKVLGANRGNLVRQFYIESALVTGIAIIIGLLLFFVFRTWLYNLLQFNMTKISSTAL